jgi:DNA-binding CsgD family transcriptional regulator
LEADRVRFVHPLLGSVAYDLLLPEERREFHGRLAAVSVDAAERGHHLARSALGPDGAAAVALEQAAALVAARGDHAGAASFLLRAAELTPQPAVEAAGWREARAAEQLALAGDIAAAGALAGSLVKRLPAGACRAEARLTAMLCAVGSELSYDDALAELALAIADGEGNDQLQARLQLAVTETLLGLGRFNDAVTHVRAAVRLAERAGAQAVAATALGYLGIAEAALGHGVSASSRRALELWDGIFFSAGSYSPRMALAFACLQAAAFEESEQLFDEETAAAQENGLETLEITARGHLAQAQLRSGRWAAALANARLAVEHARQAANAQVTNGASSALATAEALLGNHALARALATEGLEQAEATNDFWVSLYHRDALGLVALAEDNPQQAVDLLQPGWQLMLERCLGDPSLFAVAHLLGESYLTLGRHPEARTIADWLRSCPAAARPWCRAMTGRLDALLAAASGNHTAARAAIAAALAAHEELQEPFEHARSLLVQGRVERSARNWGSARAAFSDALERFDELGAARWSEKAAAELARLPGRRPAADTNGLTAREREIAELAAAGLANKQIAARLFVSVHTIEATLSRVYAKLAIRSRSELAGRLDGAKL